MLDRQNFPCLFGPTIRPRHWLDPWAANAVKAPDNAQRANQPIRGLRYQTPPVPTIRSHHPPKMKPATRAPFYAAMYHGLGETARSLGYALGKKMLDVSQIKAFTQHIHREYPLQAYSVNTR